MSRKVELLLQVKLVVEVDEGVEMREVVDELDYEFNNADSGRFNVVDTEIRDFAVVDSK
jgi:putative NIF3 family GTP cyclohydrolase 1 type 2